MTIVASVGHSGANKFSDVKLVQSLLNLNRQRYPEVTPRQLKMDGIVGGKTVRTLQRFQREVMQIQRPSGMVADHDPTFRALLAGVDGEINDTKLAATMPHALISNVDRYVRPITSVMRRYSIDSPIRMAHFLAQIGHESGSLRYSEELASGEAYEGRLDLGNTEPGDGKRFKGRGLIQLTGRTNYTRYSEATGVDYIANHTKLAEDPLIAADVAGWFWHDHNLNEHADRDDVTLIPRIINGGYNGLEDRVRFLERARVLLAVTAG